MVNQLLTKTEAQKYLGISYSILNGIVKSGTLGFLKVNKRIMFTSEELERWKGNLTYHTDYTKGAVSGTHTIRSSVRMAKEYSLERLLAEEAMKKQKAKQLKESQKLAKRPLPMVV